MLFGKDGKEFKNSNKNLFKSFCCQTQVPVPDTWWGQTDLNIAVWSRDKVYCRAKQGLWAIHAQNPGLPDGFQGRVFKGRYGGRAAGYMAFFWSAGGEVMG